MNILFIGMYPDEVNKYRNVFFRNLIYAMADMGINCTVVSPIPVTRYRANTLRVSKQRVDTTPKKSKVEVYHPRYISFSAKKIGKVNTGLITEKLFQVSALRCAKNINKKFDAVYGHFFLSGGLAAIKYGCTNNIPAFVAYGECNYDTEIVNLFRPLRQTDIEGLSGIIAVSTNNANVLKGKTLFREIPMIIAPNSVDLSLFFKRDKDVCRKELGLPQDKFIVGFVGGFVERKGDKRLLEAVNRIDDIYVAFAGRGDNPPSGDKVVFCKALEHEQIPVFLNAVDVFCLPTQNEGSCNAVVEAAACGLPIISSDLPFNDDILTKENSIRMDPNDVDAIAEAIKTLRDDPVLRQKMSEKALETAKNLTIQKRAENILAFMDRRSDK